MQNEPQNDLDRKLVKYVHCLLIIWINMNVRLVKILVFNQVLLTKQNLIIQIKSQNQPKKRPKRKNLMKYKSHYGLKLIRNHFNSLIEDVNNNLNNNTFKTTIKKIYNLKNSKKFLLAIDAQIISKKDAEKLYFNLITPDINKLTDVKSSRVKNRRNNILNVLKNL